MEQDIKPTLILKDSQHNLLYSPSREHATEKRDTIKLVDNAAKLEMSEVLAALVKSEPNIPGYGSVQTKQQERVSEQEIVPTMLSPNQEEIMRGVLKHWTTIDESQKTTNIFQKVVSEVIDTHKQPCLKASSGNNEINVSVGEFSEELGQGRKSGSLEKESHQRFQISTTENAIPKYNNSDSNSDVVDDLISFDETSTVTAGHYKQIADSFEDIQDGHNFIHFSSFNHTGTDSLNTIDTPIDSDALMPVSIRQLSSIEPGIHDNNGSTSSTGQFSVEAIQVNVENSYLLMDMTASNPSIQQLQPNQAQQAGKVSSIVSNQSQTSNVPSTNETFEGDSRHGDVRDIEQDTVSAKPIETSAASRTLITNDHSYDETSASTKAPTTTDHSPHETSAAPRTLTTTDHSSNETSASTRKHTTTDHSPHETSASTRTPTTTDHSSPRAAGREVENEVVMRPKTARTSLVRETATRQPDSSISKNKRPESMAEVPRSSTSSNRLTDMRKSFTIDKSLPPLRQLSALRPLSASMSDLSRFDGEQTGRPASLTFTTSSFSGRAPRIDYPKTRDNDGLPFQVDVLKGIVGIGLKVKVTAKGQVQITEIQRGGPVEKNGHVRVGDFLLFVNSTELTGQTDARVQQVLRLLPRGLTKLVISSSAPASSTGSRLSLYDKNSTNAQHLQQSESLRSSRSFGSHTHIAVNGREPDTFGVNKKSTDHRIPSPRLSTESTTRGSLEAKATPVQAADQNSLSQSSHLETQAAQDSLSQSSHLETQAAQVSLSQSSTLETQAGQDSVSQSFPLQSQAGQDSLSQSFPLQPQAAQVSLSQTFPLQSQAAQDSLSQTFPLQSQPAQDSLPQSFPLQSQAAQDSLPQSSHLETQAVDVVVRPKPAPRLHNANNDNHEKTLIENTKLKKLQDSKSTETQITVVKHPPDQEVGTRLTHHQDSERSKDEFVPRAAVRVTSAAITKPRPKSSSSIEFDTTIDQVTFPTASIRSTTRSNPSIYDLDKKEVESVSTRINEKLDTTIKNSKEVDTIFSGLSETIDSTAKTSEEVNRMYPRTINISEPTSRKEFNANVVSTRTTSSVSTPGNPAHPPIGPPRQLDEPGTTKPQRKISLGYERFQSIIGATKSSSIIEKSGTFVSSKARLFDQNMPVNEESPSDQATRTRRKSESLMVNLERSRNINPPLSSTIRLSDQIEPAREESPSDQATRTRRKSESLMVNLERSRNINPPLSSTIRLSDQIEPAREESPSDQAARTRRKSESLMVNLERSRNTNPPLSSTVRLTDQIELASEDALLDQATRTRRKSESLMVNLERSRNTNPPLKSLQERWKSTENVSLSHDSKQSGPSYSRSRSTISYAPPAKVTSSSTLDRSRKYSETVLSSSHMNSALSPRKASFDTPTITTPMVKTNKFYNAYQPSAGKLLSERKTIFEKAEISQTAQLNPNKPEHPGTFKSTSSISVLRSKTSEHSSPGYRDKIEHPSSSYRDKIEHPSSAYRDKIAQSVISRDKSGKPYISSLQFTTPSHNSEENEEVFGNNVNKLDVSPSQRTNRTPSDSLNDSPYQRTNRTRLDSLNDSPYQRTNRTPPDSLNDSPYQRTNRTPHEPLNDSRYQHTDTDPQDLSLRFPEVQSSVSTSPSDPPAGTAATPNLIEPQSVNITNQLYEFLIPVTIQSEKPNDSSLHTTQSQELRKDKALIDTLNETCETEEMKEKETFSRTQEISLNTLTGTFHSADSRRLGETFLGDKDLRNVSTNSLGYSNNDSELHHNTAHTQGYKDTDIVTRKDKNNDDIIQEETSSHHSVEVDAFVSSSENYPPALPSAPPPPLPPSDTNLLVNVHDVENRTASPLPVEIKLRSVDGRLESSSSDPPSAFRSVQMRVNIHTGSFFVANKHSVTKGDQAGSNDYTDSVCVNVADRFNDRDNRQTISPGPVDMFNESSTVQAISSSPVDMFNESNTVQAISSSPVDMFNESNTVQAISSSPVDMFNYSNTVQAISSSPVDMFNESSTVQAISSSPVVDMFNESNTVQAISSSPVDMFNESNTVQAISSSPVDMFNESSTVQAMSPSPVYMFDERDNRQAISPSPVDMLSEDSGMPADEDQEVATDDAISPPGELAENAFGTYSLKNALNHAAIESELLSIESRNKQSSELATERKINNEPDNDMSILDEVFSQKDGRIKAIAEDISENKDLPPPLLPSSLPPSISSVNSSAIVQEDSLRRAIPPNVNSFLDETDASMNKNNPSKPVSRVDLIMRSESTLTSTTNPDTGNESGSYSQSTRNPNTDVQSISSESRWEITHTDSEVENSTSPHLERTDVSASNTASEAWTRVIDTSTRKIEPVAETAGVNFEIKNQDTGQHLPASQAASATQVSKTQPETRLSETPAFAGDSVSPSQAEVGRTSLQAEVGRTSSQAEVSRTSSQTEVSKMTLGFPSEERDTSKTKHNTKPANLDLVHVSERAFNDGQISHILDGESTVITSTRKWCLRSNVCQSPVLTGGSEVPAVASYTERVLLKALPYAALASMIDKANAVLDLTSPSARLWLVVLHLHGNGSPLGVDLKHEGGAVFRVTGIKKGGVVALEGGTALGDRLVAVDSLWCDHVTVMRFLSRLAKPKHDSILVLAKEENAGDTTVQQAATSFSKQDGHAASRKHESKSSKQDNSFFTDATDAALSSKSSSTVNVHPSVGTPPLPKLPAPHQELQPTDKTPQFTKQEPQLLEQKQSPRRQLPTTPRLDNPQHVNQELTPPSLNQPSTLRQERHIQTQATDKDGTVQTSSDKVQSVELSHTFSKEQIGEENNRTSVHNSRTEATTANHSLDVSVARQSKSLAELQEQSAAKGTSSGGSQADLGLGVHKLVMSIGATGVGFCLEGGIGSPKGDLPITIKRIFKGGSAEKCGLLKVQDEIHEVNGLNFSQMGHFEAWKHLKFLKNEDVHMTIRRN